MSKNLVVKDNALINASYSLDLVEQRLILLSIVEARKSQQKISQSEFLTICVQDYVNEFGLEYKKSVYSSIKGACKTLFERQFSYSKLTQKGNREVVTSRWVQSISYVDNEAIVRIKFSDEVIPLITRLERHFTSYELAQVAGLKSKYAVRLYEIVIAWRLQGRTPMIHIDELRRRLGVLDDEYNIMADFKKRIINKSISEINKHTDLSIEYEQHKQGRNITGFTFTIKIKQKTKPKTITTAKKTKTPETPVNATAKLNMTDKQRQFFAAKLSHLSECSRLPGGQESYDALASFIAQDLTREDRASFYAPLLEKIGYKQA